MKFINIARKANSIWTSLIFTLVGLLFFAISVWAIFFTPKIEYETTSATITKIEQYHSTASDSWTYQVYVDYTIDGVLYENIPYGAYDSFMKEGKTITIEYDPANPTTIQSPGSENIPYIFLAVGVAVTGFGAFNLIKSIARKSSKYDQYDQVDEATATPEQIEYVKNNMEPEHTYYFHIDTSSKLNQSSIMEDIDKHLIYECKMEKFRFFGTSTYEFVNHVSGRAEMKEIGKTVTFSSGSNRFNANTKSGFKIDGVDNWRYIASEGYSLTHSIEGIKSSYDIYRYGIHVGHIDETGTDVFGEKGSKNIFYNLPAKGFYKLTCKDSDLDAFAIICFSLARTDFVL